MTQTRNNIRQAQGRSTYDIYFEIDCDCEELLDTIGLDYHKCKDDDTQNEVCISLDKDEYMELTNGFNWALLNEQDIASMVLNTELGKYTTKVTVYKPTGDVISFY